MEIQRAMKRDFLTTARTLSEALPYLQRYDGETIVVNAAQHGFQSLRIRSLGGDQYVTAFMSFRLVFRWIDAAGNRHRSTPSPPADFEFFDDVAVKAREPAAEAPIAAAIAECSDSTLMNLASNSPLAHISDSNSTI